MAIAPRFYFKYDRVTGKTLIYTVEGELWGEAAFDQKKGRTTIHQYQSSIASLIWEPVYGSLLIEI